MNRRDFLVRSSQAAAAVAVSQVPSYAEAQEPKRKPNVIWLIADQWRGQAVGCNGDPNVSTPNVDRLAGTGVNFAQARSGFPLCCPFRGSMLTSRYPHHMVPGHEYPLPPNQPTLANLFNDAGYHTGYFGKWHLDGFHEGPPGSPRGAFHIVPPERRGGFHTWIGYENNNSQYDSWVHGGHDPHEAFAPRRLAGYESDSLTDLFIAYIRERSTALKKSGGQPFFGVLSVQPPHPPHVAPPAEAGRFNAERLKLRPNVPEIPKFTENVRQQLAKYYAQIENWDWNIGRIVDALTQEGLLDETHIIVFGDHGDSLGSQGQMLKENPYEEAISIPMILSGARSYYGNGAGRPPTLFAAVDIAPTTLGLCGINAPSWMEGRDYSSHRLLSKKPHTPDPDSLYLQVVKPSMNGDSIDEPYRGLVTSDGWKYVCFANQSWLMFNLNDDPYEQQNLAFNPKYKVERARLISRLKQWVTDTQDEFAVAQA